MSARAPPIVVDLDHCHIWLEMVPSGSVRVAVNLVLGLVPHRRQGYGPVLVHVGHLDHDILRAHIQGLVGGLDSDLVRVVCARRIFEVGLLLDSSARRYQSC